MSADDVFPPEMQDHPTSPIDPLDDDTAERLLAGHLHPWDAPPPYAAVARVLQAAAAPPTPAELAGQPAALAAFRSLHPRPTGSRARPTGSRARPTGSRGRPTGSRGRPTGSRGRPAGSRGRPAGSRGRPAGARGRLVAVALAGILVAGGLWTAHVTTLVPGLRSPTGGPSAAGSGSGVSGSGVSGSGVSGSVFGSLRAATTTSVTTPAMAPVPDRHGGKAASRPGGSMRLAGPGRLGAPPAPKANGKLKEKRAKAKPEKAGNPHGAKRK